jgi:glycosyltransferase involved in cell wall biosynthesis
MDAAPARVCLGMPLFNRTGLLKEALESLRVQTFADYRLVVLDDSTDDAPGGLVREYVARDPRIDYIANPTRKGMIANWQACVQAAGRAHYFAWVGDHDRWEPTWLEALVAALEANPKAVLAYPLTAHLETDGSGRKKKLVHTFSTVGLSPYERVKAVGLRAKGFGKMVYGLFRVDALRAAGVFRRLLFPDVVLLLELSLYGEFVQVEQKLWYRRKTAEFSVSRQRQTLFGEQVPWHAYLPWPIVNAGALLWNVSRRTDAACGWRPWLAICLSGLYLQRWIGKYGEGTWIGSYHEWRHGKKPWMKKVKRYLRKSEH